MASIGKVFAELGLENREFKAKLDDSTAKVKQSATAWKAGFEKGAKASKKASKVIQKGTNTTTAGLQQAGTAISGTTAALQLMGTGGSAAIGTLTAGLASMAAQGFTPVGVALGLMSAALSVAVFKLTETDEAAEKAEAALKSLGTETETVAANIAGLSIQLKSLREGVVLGNTEVQIRLLEKQLRLVKRTLSTNVKFSSDEREHAEAQEIAILRKIQALERERKLRQEVLALTKQLAENEAFKPPKTPLVLSLRQVQLLGDSTLLNLIDQVEQRDHLLDSIKRTAEEAKKAQAVLDKLNKGFKPPDQPMVLSLKQMRFLSKKQLIDLNQQVDTRTTLLDNIKATHAIQQMQLEIDVERAEHLEDEYQAHLRLQQQLLKEHELLMSTDTLLLDIAAGIEGTVSSTLADAIINGEKLNDVLKDVLRSIAEIAIREIIGQQVSGAASALTQGLQLSSKVDQGTDPDFKPKPRPFLKAFATGGSFRVGGAGGTDSQMVAFKATPNEVVNVSTPSQQRGGGTVVNITNASGEPVSESRRTQDQQEIIDVVIGKVEQSIERGGKVGKAVERTFGNRRSGRRA